jgi:hypothetical protein
MRHAKHKKGRTYERVRTCANQTHGERKKPDMEKRNDEKGKERETKCHGDEEEGEREQ